MYDFSNVVQFVCLFISLLFQLWYNFYFGLSFCALVLCSRMKCLNLCWKDKDNLGMTSFSKISVMYNSHQKSLGVFCTELPPLLPYSSDSKC